MITHARVMRIAPIQENNEIPEKELMVLKGKKFQILSDNVIDLEEGLLVGLADDGSIEVNFNYNDGYDFIGNLEEKLETLGAL